MKQWLNQNQKGEVSGVLIGLIGTVILLVASISFGVWAFLGRQDYKNNVDAKIVTAVEVSNKELESQKENEFKEREKEPLKTYQGPSEYGGIAVKYPKTWSGYIAGGGNNPIDGYFHAGTVPGINSKSTYALRVVVSNNSYVREVSSFDSSVASGKVKTKAYKPENVKGVVGLRVEGEISNGKQGIAVLLPTRDKTIILFTESDQFYNDFDKLILPNFSFTP